MDDKQMRKRIRRMWLWSLAAILVGQGVIAAALFIPQNRQLQNLALQEAFDEEAVLSQARSIQILRLSNANLDSAETELAALNLPGDLPPPQAMLIALKEAKEAEQVQILGFFRPREAGDEVPFEESPVWNLQIQSEFGKAVRFLNRIEKEGVLLDSGGFRLVAGPEGEGVRVEAALVSHTGKTLQGGVQTAQAVQRKGARR